MGIATLLVGFMPSYAQIGLAAPIIVSILRFCQGLGVGGEWGGSVLLVMEYGHKRNRGFWASWPQMGVPIGLLLSTYIVKLFNPGTAANPNPAFFDASATGVFWNGTWRIPFFISAALILIGLYIRLRILETPLFAKVQAENRVAASPVAEAFKKNTPEILLSAGARFVEQAPFYLFATFSITYVVEHLKLTSDLVLDGIALAAIVELVTIPLFSYLSDSVGRRRWYLIGCVIMAAFAFPYFALLNTLNSGLVILAIVLSFALCHAWVYGPQAALIAERFGTRSRYSSASLGYQLAAPFAGGLAPLIALLLLTGKTDLSTVGGSALKHVVINIGAGSWQAVSVYIVVLAIISFLSVLGLRDMTQADISGETPVVPSAVEAGSTKSAQHSGGAGIACLSCSGSGTACETCSQAVDYIYRRKQGCGSREPHPCFRRGNPGLRDRNGYLSLRLSRRAFTSSDYGGIAVGQAA